MSKQDYYEILNLSKDATDEDIKKAYRRLAKKYHPDLNQGNKEEAEQKFKEINEAYEVLSNPEKRSRYDRFGHAGVDGQTGGFNGFGDIFDDIFDIFGGGFSSSSSRKPGPRRGPDIRYDIDLEFEEAVFGVEKEVQIRKVENCSTCNGSGVKPGSSKSTCSKCNGTGEVRYAQNTPFGQFVRVGTCDACNGTGEIIKDKCDTCHGTGKVRKSNKIKVKIPAGVNNGSIISLKEEGHAGERGGPSGDLYIYIRVKPHEFFVREGNNIYCEIPITFTQAALGTDIEIPTLEEPVKYQIPPGTQTGTQFKLKNKGVPNVRGYGKGDFYFKVNVKVPKKLNDKQKELLREFAKESGEDTTEVKKGFFDKFKDAFN
ncbi:molecular chaperone DnaJ [Anaerosalibacter massiliensis]|uniref:Chaperone protein DnaJ n=1 Tax=Anaerosalibacter massiliensis TaxID=1347392 RepID=A0A9X2MPV0_9FIRM|nr:molecular chaperone DnaJ [Anaerosalibacter massiliensis]MCR2044961.1 molecular chaperone DnaJ [Anaerosalibacter massiliensis]